MAAIFNNFPRTDSSKIRSGETRLEWLDRAASPQCEVGRRVLNTFFAPLAPMQQHRFRRRLESDRDHDNVIAEVYSYNVFTELGFNVQYEPAIGTRSNPDLLISADGTSIAVDVTIDGGLGSFNRRQNRINRLLDQIDERIKIVGFAFAVGDCREGHANPSPAKMARQIQKLADSINHSTLLALGPSGPEHVVEDPSTGWRLALTPIPFKDGSMAAGSAFGMKTTGTWGGDCIGDVRAKVREKVAQHRDLPYPLLVFVVFNDLLTRPEHDEIASALYGIRHDDGLWADKRQQPLALVTGFDIFGWNMLNRELTLWANPNLESPALHRRWKHRVQRRPARPPADALNIFRQQQSDDNSQSV